MQELLELYEVLKEYRDHGLQTEFEVALPAIEGPDTDPREPYLGVIVWKGGVKRIKRGNAVALMRYIDFKESEIAELVKALRENKEHFFELYPEPSLEEQAAKAYGVSVRELTLGQIEDFKEREGYTNG